MASESGNFGLLTHGVTPLPDPVCPPLDPDAAIQISDELIGVYQSRIDALINQLGKDVHLIFDPVREPCPNCEFDNIRKRSRGIYLSGGPRPFQRGRTCPWCKGAGLLETSREKCILALTKWAPRDAERYGISLKDYKGLVRLKTFATSLSDLVKARFAIVNHEIESIIRLRVRLTRFPILTGLRESRYCISFWELVDET